MTTLTLICETCPNPIERTGKRGPAPRFCDSCKLDRHNARQRARYVKKGRPAALPARQKYRPGWTSPSGQLTLVRRIVGDPDRAWFECACGSVAKVLHIHNVASGLTQNCAEREWHTDPRSVGEAAAYSTAHHRLAKLHGPASAHPCFVCGEQADGWAFLHGTPDVKADATGKDAGRPYSTDPEQYAPACKSHHKRWDNSKDRMAGTGLSLAHRALWLATRGEEVAAA
ncbi:hypothetical protein [Streptomyces sp. V4I2]|uniref:hypothetical protein n=1 Tax=Streptomyces sp. V4I2 TaxID=3042280 RepID=UPI0027810D99|nr:hypothetical protein [Streptomyces sp. V4I2]MDQ1044315.1 hypothetical protein [Streptomyces sp. V4I2]